MLAGSSTVAGRRRHKMIAAVKGTVFDISPGHVQLETAGGVIYHLLTPVSSYTAIKRDKDVLLHSVLKVKDDQMILYGFLTVKEKYFFREADVDFRCWR